MSLCSGAFAQKITFVTAKPNANDKYAVPDFVSADGSSIVGHGIGADGGASNAFIYDIASHTFYTVELPYVRINAISKDGHVFAGKYRLPGYAVIGFRAQLVNGVLTSQDVQILNTGTEVMAMSENGEKLFCTVTDLYNRSLPYVWTQAAGFQKIPLYLPNTVGTVASCSIDGKWVFCSQPADFGKFAAYRWSPDKGIEFVADGTVRNCSNSGDSAIIYGTPTISATSNWLWKRNLPPVALPTVTTSVNGFRNVSMDGTYAFGGDFLFNGIHFLNLPGKELDNASIDNFRFFGSSNGVDYGLYQAGTGWMDLKQLLLNAHQAVSSYYFPSRIDYNFGEDYSKRRLANDNGTRFAGVAYQAIDGQRVRTMYYVDMPTLTAKADAYTVLKNNTLTVAAPGVLSNDAYSYLAKAMIVRGAANGYVALSKSGAFTYKPKTDFVGTDAFTYRAVRGPVISSAVKVTITVKAS